MNQNKYGDFQIYISVPLIKCIRTLVQCITLCIDLSLNDTVKQFLYAIIIMIKKVRILRFTMENYVLLKKTVTENSAS